MTDTITLTGLIATTPRHLVTSEGLPITSFRLASSQRRFDRSKEKWVDGETNWYTITTFRQLAINAAGSLAKGERVILSGRLRIRDWESDGRAGTNIDVEADAIGHDLSWGTAAFTRTISTASVSASTEQTASQSGADESTGWAADPSSSAHANEGEDADSSDGELADGEVRVDRIPVPF